MTTDPFPSDPFSIPSNDPIIVVGLGNLGKPYAHNRHNVGYMLVSLVAEKIGGIFNKVESRALIAKADFQSHRVILAKPQTYMNASGNSVRSLVRFYKIPLANLLVVSDDVDLPLETIRLRPSGGSGGQKGVQSIIEQLGTENFPRLRIGINRPPGRMEAADYVLQDFSRDELFGLKLALDRAVEAVLCFVTYGLDQAMNAYNGRNDSET